MFTLPQIESAADFVHRYMPPTPQYAWPLLAQRCGTEVWVKHENHTPIGAFKLRGGLIYLNHIRGTHQDVSGVIAATRGNHGQSIATAARLLDLKATLVVPEGNSREKNAAMAAQGGRLIVAGHDFQAALEECRRLAAEDNLFMIESFHEQLVLGVASYSLELFAAQPDLDALYVPIGLGSGICGAIAARDALDLRCGIIGVVAENAPCYARSFAAGKPVSTNAADTFADGMACRVPMPDAVAMINRGADRIVTVSEAEIAEAVRILYSDTHNLAEGAGAAALAALLQERETVAGRKVAVVLSGGNIDREVYLKVLGTP